MHIGVSRQQPVNQDLLDRRMQIVEMTAARARAGGEHIMWNAALIEGWRQKINRSWVSGQWIG